MNKNPRLFEVQFDNDPFTIRVKARTVIEAIKLAKPKYGRLTDHIIFNNVIATAI